MGCIKSKDSPANPAKTIQVVENKQQEPEPTAEEVEMRKEQFCFALEGFCEMGDYKSALLSYLDICHLDTKVNKTEGGFTYSCFEGFFPLYYKVSQDKDLPFYYLQAIIWNYTWRNVLQQGALLPAVGRSYREYGKLLAEKKKKISAIIYLELSQAAGDAGGHELLENIISGLTEDEKKVCNSIKPSIENLKDLRKTVKFENNTIAEIYIKIAKTLTDYKKYSEAMILYKRALDTYTAGNFQSKNLGEKIGLIYYEMGIVAKSKNKYSRASVYFFLARCLTTDNLQADADAQLRKITPLLSKSINYETDCPKLTELLTKDKTETEESYEVLINMGSTLQKQGFKEEGACFLRRALAFITYKSFENKEKGDRLAQVLLELSDFYLFKKKYSKAQFFGERAAPLVKDEKVNDLVDKLKDIYVENSKKNPEPLIPAMVRKLFDKAHEKKVNAGLKQQPIHPLAQIQQKYDNKI